MGNRLLGVLCWAACGFVLSATNWAISLPAGFLALGGFIFMSMGSKEAKQKQGAAKQQNGGLGKGLLVGTAVAVNEYNKDKKKRAANLKAKEDARKAHVAYVAEAEWYNKHMKP